MRITGGTLRGRLIKSPQNQDIRPTSDKARQAVFNMLSARGVIEGAVVLDAFCGTGALGLEALSHGARQTVFIDKSKTSLALCKKNAAELNLTHQCFFLLKDASRLGPKPDDTPPAHLVFLDPPYGKNLIPETLLALQKENWLASECTIVSEFGRKEDITLPGTDLIQDKTYGDTRIIISQITPL